MRLSYLRRDDDIGSCGDIGVFNSYGFRCLTPYHDSCVPLALLAAKRIRTRTWSIDAQHFATEIVQIAKSFYLRVIWVTELGKASDLISKSCLDIRTDRENVDRPSECGRRRFMT